MISLEELKDLLHYNPDTGDFVRLVQRQKFKAGELAGSYDAYGYLCIEINGKGYKASRLAWLYMTGSWPENEIDHEDTDRSNNKWSNLREATRLQNSHNRNYRNKNGFKGVAKRRKGYEARITINGKLTYLGLYDTAEEAHEKYKLAAEEHQKEFMLQSLKS